MVFLFWWGQRQNISLSPYIDCQLTHPMYFILGFVFMWPLGNVFNGWKETEVNYWIVLNLVYGQNNSVTDR